MDEDELARARAPRSDRAALGPTGLTPQKAKRSALAEAEADGTVADADLEPAPSSDATIIMAVDDGAEAMRSGSAAAADAGAAADARAAVLTISYEQKSPCYDTSEVRDAGKRLQQSGPS